MSPPRFAFATLLRAVGLFATNVDALRAVCDNNVATGVPKPNDLDHAHAALPDGFAWANRDLVLPDRGGSPDADGKGMSIWDTFAHTPARSPTARPAMSPVTTTAGGPGPRPAPTGGLQRLPLLTVLATHPPGHRPGGIRRASTSTTASSTVCSPGASRRSRRSTAGTCRRRCGCRGWYERSWRRKPSPSTHRWSPGGSGTGPAPSSP